MNQRTAYDHEIIVSGQKSGNPIRLHLARGQDGKALYEVTEHIPQHDERIEWTQKDWRGGHGQYKVLDPTMFFDGQSIDTTQEGRVILGPKINEVYTGAVKKQNYESGQDDYSGVWTGQWIAQTFTPSDSHTVGAVRLYLAIPSGATPGIATVSIRATSGGYPTGSDLAVGTFDANVVTTSYAWYTIILTTGVALSSGTKYAIVLRTDADTAARALNWGSDNSAPSYSDGQMTYSNDSGATWYGGASDLLFSEWALATTALDTTPTHYLWSAVAGKALCATSGKIYYHNGVDWTAATTTVAGVTDLIEYNGVIYAAVGASTLWYYSTDGDTWTQTDLTNAQANKFIVAPNADGTQDILYAFKAPNELRTTTNGKLAAAGGVALSSAAYIGDTTSDITNGLLLNDELLLGREDNLYQYKNIGGGGAGTVPLMNELLQARSVENFRYVQNWQSAVYFSRGNGVGELIGQAPGVFSMMGPLQETGDIDKVGVVRGIAADTDYLYVAMLEGTVTHIYKGKPVETASGIRWAWCPWIYLGTNQCEDIYVAQHTQTDRRLWFGYGTHTGYVQITDNPTADANARFAASGWLRMSYNYGSNPFWDKMIQSVVTETKGCTANITARPYYRKDTETSMTALTAAITTNGVNKTNLTTQLSGKRFQLELDLATNDSTITPEVLMFTARGHEKPEIFRIHKCTYLIGDNPHETTESVRGYLRAARTSTTLVKFADLYFGEAADGATAGTDYHYVVMLPGYPREVEVGQERGKTREMALEVVWAEVNFT